MKKILFLLLIILCGTCFYSPAMAETPEKIQVVTVKAQVFETADVNSPLKNGDDNVFTYHGDVFNVVSLQGEFFEIEWEDSSAFVLKAYVMDVQNYSSGVKLDTNATINKDCRVFEKFGQDFVESEVALNKNDRVKILDGVESENQFLRITYERDQKQYTCYVLKDNVSPDGLSVRALTAIGLIIACISIILILFGFKGKRKRRKV